MTAKMHARLVEMFHAGIGDAAMAYVAGTSIMYIRKWRRLRGLLRQHKPVYAGWTPARVLALRELGMTARQVSELSGFTLNTVYLYTTRARRAKLTAARAGEAA
jgi:hypothetical protein